jgi:predicted transcriptional regulator
LSIEVEHKEKEKDRIDWRRSKVQELNSQGYSQREIAQMLQVSNGTVNKDLSILREQAKSIIKRYIDERLPEEYEKCMVGLNAILREAWTTSQQTEDKREKIQALSLAKECYSMKLDLLTNATVVDDAIRFVSDRSKDKENLTSSTGNSNEDDRDESNKPDYDEDKDQLEEEQGQQTGEITTATFVGTTIIAFALRKKLIQKMN